MNELAKRQYDFEEKILVFSLYFYHLSGLIAFFHECKYLMISTSAVINIIITGGDENHFYINYTKQFISTSFMLEFMHIK